MNAQHNHPIYDGSIVADCPACIDKYAPAEPRPAEGAPADPSSTPWDFSTWGFYCDHCKTFFDLATEGDVRLLTGINVSNSTYWHKACGKEARYIGYDRSKSVPTSRRATGRTIPDLTKREHVCEYQSAVRAALPTPSNTGPAATDHDGTKLCPTCLMPMLRPSPDGASERAARIAPDMKAIEKEAREWFANKYATSIYDQDDWFPKDVAEFVFQFVFPRGA